MIVDKKWLAENVKGNCPILDQDWPKRINLTAGEIASFCAPGCCVICNRLFIEHWGRRMMEAGIEVNGNKEQSLF